MKKSLIFWFAAVTCAALFLVGCESPTNGDAGSAGPAGPATLPASASPALLKAYFAETNKVFVVAALGAGTFEVPAGKTLAVVGDVDISSVDDTVINAYYGTLDVSDGGFTVDGGNVFIVPQAKVAEVKAALTGAGVVPEKFTGTLSGSTPALTAPAVFESLGIGGSGQITAADFATFTASNIAYVVGDVTIDASTAAVLSSANLTVYGEIKVGGTAASLTLGANVKGSLTATSNLTLAGTITGVTKLNTGTYTVSSALTSVSLPELDSGTGGKLSLTGAVTAVTITGGNGNIEFSTGTPAFASNPSNFGNTGLTTFKAAAGSTNVALTFAGPVAFEADFERTTGGAYSFGGDVTITSTKALTLGGTDTVTLAEGKSIKVGSDAVLSAGTAAEVVLTPVSGAVLTATAAGGGSPAKIAASTQNITVTSGTLAVSGELESTNKNITIATGATLSIAPSGKVTTKGDVGSGAVVLGDSTNGVTLTGAGSWTAGGAAVYLTQTATDAAAIGASGAATLTASGTPTITVLAGSSAANVLTLGAGVTINVAGTAAKVGAVVLTGAGSNVGTLKLVDGTSKVITGNTGGTAYSTGVKQSNVAAVSTLNSTVIVTVNANKIVSVAGGGAGNGTIAGGGSGTISIDGATETTDAAA